MLLCAQYDAKISAVEKALKQTVSDVETSMTLKEIRKELENANIAPMKIEKQEDAIKAASAEVLLTVHTRYAYRKIREGAFQRSARAIRWAPWRTSKQTKKRDSICTAKTFIKNAIAAKREMVGEIPSETGYSNYCGRYIN